MGNCTNITCCENIHKRVHTLDELLTRGKVGIPGERLILVLEILKMAVQITLTGLEGDKNFQTD